MLIPCWRVYGSSGRYSLADRFPAQHQRTYPTAQETGRPEVLTVNGKAEIVVQDAASYQKTPGIDDRAEAIEGIQKGLESMQRGEGKPAQEVFTRLRKKHNISHDA